MGPLGADHPLVDEKECPACGYAFEAGDLVTLIAVGPGPDPEEQEKARAGRPYNAVALPVHWLCATGEPNGRSL
jgi:hypothetical protein